MIKEANVSFEVAKLLKEKGFNVPTEMVWYEHIPSCNVVHEREAGSKKLDYFYWDENTERNSFYTNDTNENGMPVYITGKVYSAPTQQMAMKWLREHGLHVNVSISYDCSVDADGNEVDRWTFYMFEICSSFSGNLIYTEEVNEYDSYEEAVEAALKYTLENLI